MKIPKSELLVPGVECRTQFQGNFVITSNELRNRFTLWKQTDDGFEKKSTSKSIMDLYDKIPWNKK